MRERRPLTGLQHRENHWTYVWKCKVRQAGKVREGINGTFQRICCCCSVTQSYMILWNLWTVAHQASLSFTVSCSKSCPLSHWCHPTISSSVIPFSSCLQSSPGSGSFPMNLIYESSDPSFGASASTSVLPMNIQDLYPLELIDLVSLQSKELSRVFSTAIFWRHQFFIFKFFFIVQLTTIRDYW